MNEMKFGVSLLQWTDSVPPTADMQQIEIFGSLAESGGFDSVFIPDHNDMPLEAMTTLAFVAARTKRLKFGTAVIDSARRSPAILAQETSTLDILSGGRLIVGLGKGSGSNAATYDAPVLKRVRRMGEMIELLLKFWTEDKVRYKGSCFTFENASIVAKPLQRPHPPIWVAAFTEKVFEVVARFADGWIVQNTSSNDCRSKYEKLSRLRETTGRSKLQAVFAAPVAVSKGREEAFKAIEPTARDFLSRCSGPPFHIARALGYASHWTRTSEVPREAIERCYIFGTPDECVSKIAQYREAGIDYIVCLPILPMGTKGLQLFAEEVIPHFRE
jgi:alkanesulfonate monooxygenase SsuD/methylene tetrahydromethanopterin reductase-like flavin-dependent oxidoreductase (luciferase family)